MDETMDKKRPLSDLMRSTMDKIREMADTNTIVGQPITCLLYTSPSPRD